MKTGKNSYDKFALAGQNRGQKTRRQQAQQVCDKQRHRMQRTRAFPMAALNPPVIVKPFSHMGQPGTEKVIHSGGTRLGWFPKTKTPRI